MYTYSDIYEVDPCSAGREWLQECEASRKTLTQAWDECPDIEWMFWWLRKSGHMTPELDLRLQLAMLDTPLSDGRTVRDLLTDECSLAFVVLKERRLAGEVISDEEWDAAWSAARAAAQDAAWSAARAAAWVAAADAAWAAANAAGDAAWVAAAGAAWDAAWAALGVADNAALAAVDDAAQEAAKRWQRGKLREIVGNPFQESGE